MPVNFPTIITQPIVPTNFSSLDPTHANNALSQVSNQHSQGAADQVTLNKIDPNTQDILTHNSNGAAANIYKGKEVSGQPDLHNNDNLPHTIPSVGVFAGLTPNKGDGTPIQDATQNNQYGTNAYNQQLQRFWNNFDFSKTMVNKDPAPDKAVDPGIQSTNSSPSTAGVGQPSAGMLNSRIQSAAQAQSDMQSQAQQGLIQAGGGTWQ